MKMLETFGPALISPLMVDLLVFREVRLSPKYYRESRYKNQAEVKVV
jgi:hypothetical protein